MPPKLNLTEPSAEKCAEMERTAVSKVAVVFAIAVMQLLVLAPGLATATATSTAGVSAVDGRDLAAKVGVRRFLQDQCIPPGEICCSHCWSWPADFLKEVNCCDPDTYICLVDPRFAGATEWCARRDTGLP
jgi:hypothetical protein